MKRHNMTFNLQCKPTVVHYGILNASLILYSQLIPKPIPMLHAENHEA